jgi:WD40 repeat protein
VTSDRIFAIHGSSLWVITEVSEKASVKSYLETGMGRPALLACGDTVFALDSRDGTALRDLTSGEKVGEVQLPVRAIAGGVLSGKPLALTGGHDGTLQAWDTDSPEQPLWAIPCEVGSLEVVTVGVAEGVPVAAVAGADRALRIVDLAQGAPIGGPIVGHTARVTSVAFGELDGRAIVVSGSDDRSVRVWDMHAGVDTPPPRPDYPGPIRAVSVCHTHEGRQAIASAGRDGSLRLVKLDNGTEMARLTEMGTLDSVAMFAEAKRTIVGAGSGKSFVVGEFANGKLRQTVRNGDGEPCSAVQVVEVGGEAHFAVACDRVVALQSVSSGRGIGPTAGGHEGGVTALAATTRHGVPLAVSGGGEGGLLKWDLEARGEAAPLVRAHSRHVTAVAVADLGERGVIVTAGGEGNMRIWDLDTMDDYGVDFEGHTDWVRSIAVGSLEGVPIIVSGGDDYTVRVWTVGGRSLQTIMLATAVRSLAISGSTVIVGADVGLTAIDLSK